MKQIITDIEYLRQKSSDIKTEEVQRIVKDIKSSISGAWTDGVGLAGIQIGEPLRVAWYKMPNTGPSWNTEEVVLINPEILELKDKFMFSGEGCLSMPNQRFLTERYRYIKLKNNGRTYVAYDMEAVVIQHEIDHMEGILCLDRAYKKAPGRNEPCPCNSGKKYKKCCGR